MKLREAFGNNLRRLRRERKISQDELASRAGLARAYISAAEAGRRNATLDTVEMLAAALGVHPMDLLSMPA